jgi:hypothetical protein
VTTEFCLNNYGQYYKIYGICGGPDGTSSTHCILPGTALCEACPYEASLSADYGGLNIACGDQQYDDSFWSLASGDRADCCADLLTEVQSFHPIDGQPYFASRNSWLYDSFESCTALRTTYPAP